MLFTDLNIVDKVETLAMAMIAVMVWRCVDSLSPAPDVPALIVSPRITLSLVIIMGTGLITPDHHPTRITNDRIMHVFSIINTKPTIKTTLNRKFMSLFIIFSGFLID